VRVRAPFIIDLLDHPTEAVLQRMHPYHGNLGIERRAHDIRGSPLAAFGQSIPDGNQ
jgi:hypothetical protein